MKRKRQREKTAKRRGRKGGYHVVTIRMTDEQYQRLLSRLDDRTIQGYCLNKILGESYILDDPADSDEDDTERFFS